MSGKITNRASEQKVKGKDLVDKFDKSATISSMACKHVMMHLTCSL